MMQLLAVFLEQHYQVTFATTAAKTAHTANLKALGILEVTVLLNDPEFDRFVGNLSPDLVIFDRFMMEEQFGWRVAEAHPQAVRILNTEDLHSLREYRELCVKQGMDFTPREWLLQDKTKREMASIYRSDLTLLTSSFEKKILQEQLQLAPELLLYLPFMLTTPGKRTIAEWLSFSERKDFVSYGNGKHAPNLDSFVYLKTTIWPLIREALPTARLHIYGAYFPQQLQQLHNPSEGFLVQGWVEDLEGVVNQARIVLAPVRFGAGIKGKLTFGMQQGTPSVTTTIGAEGMHDSLPWSGAIADSPEQFTEKAVALYTNEQKWKEMQQYGLDILKGIYSREKCAKAFLETLLSLSDSLENHRKQNFIGALLQHQTMAATRYMGKWIAEKNKNKDN